METFATTDCRSETPLPGSTNLLSPGRQLLHRLRDEGVILVDEWERHGAMPAFVTEDLDQSPIGKVILSLKGFAAEVEREKIQERTMRGLRSRMAAGKLKLPSDGFRLQKEHCSPSATAFSAEILSSSGMS